jgi:hypothetical protein
MKRLLMTAFFVALSALSARAEGVTVDALLKQGFEVKAAFPSNAGPGLVLQKGDDAIMCFVAETKTSGDVATQYCKPVH